MSSSPIIEHSCDFVKVSPETWALAFRRKLSRLYRAWCLMRACDADGRGWVLVAAFAEFVARHGIIGFANLRRLLNHPDAPIFWDLQSWQMGRVIVIRSGDAVQKALE
jgi:hypothetical protein